MAISLVSQRVPVVRWAAEHGLTVPLALIDGDLFAALRVDQAPSTVFVKQKRIVGRSHQVVPHRFLRRHVGTLAE